MDKPLRVLLVEDSEDDALLLERALKKAGFAALVRRVETKRGMEQALADPWDAVISDYVLPQFSGLEALACLKASGLDIPFIMVSGKVGEETAVEAMREGAKDFITKNNLSRLGPAISRELEDAQERGKRRLLEQEQKASMQKLQMALEQAIAAIAATIEKRDPYTAGHQQRVASIAEAIGKEMGLDSTCIHGIRLGSLIHDIGKIYVPAEILNRPGRLTPEEFGLIKTHPVVGYEIVADVDFPWPVAEMVRHHHERLNGSGYPDALTSNSIGIETKILAVADVVEAMSSHRPYRPSLGMDRALEEIESHRGVLYDEKVVSACVSLFLCKGFSLPKTE